VLAEKSEEQKLRADIGKQVGKFVDCVGKAGLKCEKGTDPFTQSCSLATGATNLDPMSPGDAAGKFAADVAKCESKVDFLKKADLLDALTGYQAMGCPGDADPDTVGEQPFVDMMQYQSAAKSAVKTAADQFGLLAALSGCDPDPTEKPDKCVGTLEKTIATLIKSLTLCSLKCENDYKNVKGNGGGNDDDNCSVLQHASPAPTPDANMTVCEQKAFSKVASKYPGGLPALITTVVMPVVINQLNAANDSYYNVVGGNCP
jgi:hypothetical protein